jgi:hypothetical protein
MLQGATDKTGAVSVKKPELQPCHDLHLAGEKEETADIAQRKTGFGLEDTVVSLDIPVRDPVVQEVVDNHSYASGDNGSAVERRES